MGGCDYFLWYEDRHPPQANKVMWGLLKKVDASDEKLKRARNIFYYWCRNYWVGYVWNMENEA